MFCKTLLCFSGNLLRMLTNIPAHWSIESKNVTDPIQYINQCCSPYTNEFSFCLNGHIDWWILTKREYWGKFHIHWFINIKSAGQRIAFPWICKPKSICRKWHFFLIQYGFYQRISSLFSIPYRTIWIEVKKEKNALPHFHGCIKNKFCCIYYS